MFHFSITCNKLCTRTVWIEVDIITSPSFTAGGYLFSIQKSKTLPSSTAHDLCKFDSPLAKSSYGLLHRFQFRAVAVPLQGRTRFSKRSLHPEGHILGLLIFTQRPQDFEILHYCFNIIETE